MIYRRSTHCGSCAKEKDRPYQWKGDDIGYRSLHLWVARRLGKPEKCEHCKRIELHGKKINWANKTGQYLRDINDWIRLCASCHKKYDLKNHITKPSRFLKLNQ